MKVDAPAVLAISGELASPGRKDSQDGPVGLAVPSAVQPEVRFVSPGARLGRALDAAAADGAALGEPGQPGGDAMDLSAYDFTDTIWIPFEHGEGDMEAVELVDSAAANERAALGASPSARPLSLCQPAIPVRFASNGWIAIATAVAALLCAWVLLQSNDISCMDRDAGPACSDTNEEKGGFQ